MTRAGRSASGRVLRDAEGTLWGTVTYDPPLSRATSFRFANGASWAAQQGSRFRHFVVEDGTGRLGTVSYKRGASVVRGQIRWDVADASGRHVVTLRQTRVLSVPGAVVRALRGRPLVEYSGDVGGVVVAHAVQHFRKPVAIEVGLDRHQRLLVTGLVVAMLLDPSP